MENMITSINALSARSRFGEIINQVKNQNKRFLINKRGIPQVVILSIEDYFKNIIKQPKLITKLQAQAKKAGTENITNKEIEAEIKECRKEADILKE